MKLTVITLALALCAGAAPAVAREKWTVQQAGEWHAAQPWFVGANYVPASAINQIEMWQEASWDPQRIDRELGWAAAIGMNSMRVFLHDQLWTNEPDAYRQRIDAFLSIADKHDIRVMFVLFDSVWDPNPQLGPQRPPIPGVHNSGWVQGPGIAGLRDTSRYPQYKAYVEGVVHAFANDRRVLAWDVWNEPDHPASQYPGQEGKVELVNGLLEQAFVWARDANPSQPVTSAVWSGQNWSPGANTLNATQRIQLEQSDIISFHDYGWPEDFEARIAQLRPYNRPLLCTEYMARGKGSTFDGLLPIAKRERVAMMNWGLVDGKTQTRLPWDSWQRPYTLSEPAIWFHEVFRADGTPYRKAETDLIRSLTAAE